MMEILRDLVEKIFWTRPGVFQVAADEMRPPD